MLIRFLKQKIKALKFVKNQLRKLVNSNINKIMIQYKKY